MQAETLFMQFSEIHRKRRKQVVTWVEQRPQNLAPHQILSLTTPQLDALMERNRSWHLHPSLGKIRMTHWYFWKACPQVKQKEVPLLHQMLREAKAITYTTFRRAVGGDVVDAWARSHHYNVGSGHQRGVWLSKDWAASFYKSRWNGEPVYFISWSAMEQIFRRVQC